MKKVSLILFLAIPMFFNGCLVEDDCDDCNSAIKHMAEKISNYNCNPNNMQEAWDNIRNSCGAMADTYVGYMAEMCEFSYLETPKCGSILSEAGITIAFYTTSEIPGDIEITIQYPKLVGSENFVFTGKYIVMVTLSEPLAEDDEVTITLYEPGDFSEYTLASQKQKFTFARNNNWFTTRMVLISYDKTIKKYSLTFQKWGDA